MPPKAFRRQRNTAASSAAPSAPPQAASSRNPATSDSIAAVLPTPRAALADNFLDIDPVTALELEVDNFIACIPAFQRPHVEQVELRARRMGKSVQFINAVKAKLFPPSPPSPALSYASIESTVLKRPRSPGSSSSGSSRAASVMDVDMDINATESRCPTPTPSSARVGLPAPLTSSTTGLPVVNTTLSSLDMSRAATPIPQTLAARPPTPAPHVDTPVSRVPPPQPPAPAKPFPIEGLSWEEFLNAIEVVIPAISECPPALMTRYYDSAVRIQSATVKFRAPPRKKVRISPATPPAKAPAPPAAAPPPPPAAMSAPAPKKAVAAPPALTVRPDPKAAPPVSVKSTRKRRQGKHTTHGASRRGIILTPPADSLITARSFTPEIINSLNNLLEKDLKSEVCLTHAVDGNGIFIAASRVPTSAETAFVLKHVRRLFPSQSGPAITSSAATSTSYLKIVDIITDPSKDWVKITTEGFMMALKASPVGSALTDVLKNKPRIMRTSPKSDTCIMWVDIHDTVSGANAKRFIGQYISIGSFNCQIRGAKPHSGSTQCTRCMRWGHHASQCRRLGERCPLCGGPHKEINHGAMVKAEVKGHRHCVNCTAARREKRDHASTDRAKCPFWKHRFDRAWLKRQFQPPANNSNT